MEALTINTPSSKSIANNHRDHLKKEALERRRNILHLILQYLNEHNYKNTAETLLDECQMQEVQYQVCENIDLEIILQEFQSYYHTKFQKYPKILRKLDEPIVPKAGKIPRKSLNNEKKKSADSKNDEKKDDAFQIEIVPLNQKDSVLNARSLCENYDNFPVEMKEIVDVIRQQIIPKNLGCNFADCIGLSSTIETLKEAIVYPMRYPNLFANVTSWKGVLLYGPPGTGKTLLARAVACETPATFLNVSSGVFTSKWRGESEKMLRILFEIARNQAPATVFLDEIDALASANYDHEASRRFKSELLTQIDGIIKSEEVFVLATTNAPWAMDEALLRRFDKRILVPAPEAQAREQILRCFFEKAHFSEDDFRRFTDGTKDFTGSDLKNVRKEVDMMLVREKLDELRQKGRVMVGQTRQIQADDFVKALKKIRPSVTSESYRRYTEWGAKYGAV